MGMISVRWDRIDELIGKEQGRVNEVSARAEVSPDYLWKLRHGKAPNVSAVVLWRVADALGVPIDYLLGADLDERGMPVAEANIAAVVADLNRLPREWRARIGNIVSGILGLLDVALTPDVSSAVAPLSEEERRIVRALRNLSPARQVEGLRYLEVLAHEVTGESDSSTPDASGPGKAVSRATFRPSIYPCHLNYVRHNVRGANVFHSGLISGWANRKDPF